MVVIVLVLVVVLARPQTFAPDDVHRLLTDLAALAAMVAFGTLRVGATDTRS